MRLGINTSLFAGSGGDPHPRLFPRFRKWGYDTVELAIASPSDLDPLRVREQLDKYGLVAGSIHGVLGPGRDLRGPPAEQAAARQYLQDLLGLMPALGCSVLAGPMYSTLGRADIETRAAKREQWLLVKRHLRALAACAADHGVTLCIEPLNRFETDFLNTCEQAIDLIDGVDHPALRIHLDTFHMNIEEKDLGQAIRNAGSLLGHLHASGNDRGTPGTDHTNWRSISSALRFIDYQGDVVLKSCFADDDIIAPAGPLGRRAEPNRDAIAREGAKFLRRIINPEVGCEPSYLLAR
jgi:D-psicose/D-tagatose/L-ribulose 3-epimerase